MAYVDYKCLESLLIEGEELIATEGLGDKLKSIGRTAGKVLLTMINAIRKALLNLYNKFKQFISKRKNNSASSHIDQLNKEKEELLNKITRLENESRNQKDKYNKESDAMQKDNRELNDKYNKESGKHDKASVMIADLKKELKKKDDIIDSMKDRNVSNENYAEFTKECQQFVVHVTQQINKAYTALPKLISDSHKYNYTDAEKEVIRKKEGEELEYSGKLYRRLDAELPTMGSGNWSYLYKSLSYSWLPRIEKDGGYLDFNGKLGHGIEIMIKQSNRCLDYLEKIVKDFNSDERNQHNAAYKEIISEITRSEGFMDMLSSSVNLVTKILAQFEKHNVHWVSTIHDAV